MTTTSGWLLFALGIGHIGYAFVKFGAPLIAGISAGVTGQFGAPEVRRTAFWFTLFGPFLMFAGQVAVHAAATGDLHLYRLIGFYLLATSSIGALAFPKSPFLIGVVFSGFILAAGYSFL